MHFLGDIWVFSASVCTFYSIFGVLLFYECDESGVFLLMVFRFTPDKS